MKKLICVHIYHWLPNIDLLSKQIIVRIPPVLARKILSLFMKLF